MKVEELTSKDLMVGDWVEDSVGNAIEVTLYDMECLEFNEIHSIERWHFEPIPITPEILEKNDFQKDGNLYVLQGITYQIKLSKYIDSDTNWDLMVSSLEDGSCLKDKLIWHVHQLQHFMRDFEIEKEIIL